MKMLFAWLGLTDLRAAESQEGVGRGPIADAVQSLDFDQIVILSDHESGVAERYSQWLKEQTAAAVQVISCPLSGPTEFGEIYERASAVVEEHIATVSQATLVYFHLSPGTPAMAAVWILLSRTKFTATLIESSAKQGTREVTFPFDLSAEYRPDLWSRNDNKLVDLIGGRAPVGPEFDAIIHRCRPMKRLISMAAWIALRDVPILIQGESGTGKELLARAIHQVSPRRIGRFVAVNCGAIPENLMESEFFGFRRGAFTGADRDHEGYFEQASQGTLFLDEIGELPKNLQVKLLRVLQEGKVHPLGAKEPVLSNVRIIAATNRDLAEEVVKGGFREDLFHRIAVGILKLPPLRERTGDLGLLIDVIADDLNRELAGQPGFTTRVVTPSARNALLRHRWPGNVRELRNSLLRAFVWSQTQEIGAEDIENAMITCPAPDSGVLNRPLGDEFDITAVLKEVVQHYFRRALTLADGKKVQAARLVGLPSYQTFDNWMKKFEV